MTPRSARGQSLKLLHNSMKKIFILTLALCWGSVLSQPALAQTTPSKANATAGKSSAKNTSKTDKKAQKPAADKVKTVAKTDKKNAKARCR